MYFLLCSMACGVWVTVSVYRVITAVGRGWTGWIFTMTILSFMLQVGLQLCPSLPAYHDTPAANNTLVTHSHILAKCPLHRNKVIMFCGEASKNLSVSTIFTLFTHYTADKRIGNMKYSKFEQKSRQTKRQMFSLKLCRVYSKYLPRPENLASVSIKVCELRKTLSGKKWHYIVKCVFLSGELYFTSVNISLKLRP